MQCMGNSRCFPLGKMRAAIEQRYSAFAVPCVQCFHTTSSEAYSFTTDVYTESLTCAQMWVHAKHTKGALGTNKSAQESTRRDRKTVSYPVLPRDRTQGLRTWISKLYITLPPPKCDCLFSPHKRCVFRHYVVYFHRCIKLRYFKNKVKQLTIDQLTGFTQVETYTTGILTSVSYPSVWHDLCFLSTQSSSGFHVDQPTDVLRGLTVASVSWSVLLSDATEAEGTAGLLLLEFRSTEFLRGVSALSAVVLGCSGLESVYEIIKDVQ